MRSRSQPYPTPAPQAGVHKSPLTRFLIQCGIGGPLLLVVSFLVQDLTRPDYSPLRNWVSELSLGPGGWVMIATFCISGLATLGFAIGLQRALPAGPAARWGARLIGICGLGLIAAGLFVISPSGSYPPGVPAQESPSGPIHDLAGLAVFASMAASCFVLSGCFRGDPAWRGWAAYSITSGALVIACFVAASVLAALSYGGVLPGAPGGLLERIALAAGLLWMVLLAWRLRRSRALRLHGGE